METLLIPLYELEININKEIQSLFENFEPILRNLNDYVDPIFILNLWIPLAGAFSHKLLIQLVTTLGAINTLASVIKWCFPECRPIWWLRENNNKFKYLKTFEDIRLDPQSCDTTAGFPSAYTAAFTAFVLIVLYRFVRAFLTSHHFVLYNKFLIIYGLTSLLTTLMWFSRLYFLYEFLHQCLIGFLLAIALIQLFNRYYTTLMHLGKLKALIMVLGLGSIPIGFYYGMLYADVDPFWSVRMAFKWCGDPLYLKHESTPVFTLCRDFGYLLGVALSCPLGKRYLSKNNKIVGM